MLPEIVDREQREQESQQGDESEIGKCLQIETERISFYIRQFLECRQYDFDQDYSGQESHEKCKQVFGSKQDKQIAVRRTAHFPESDLFTAYPYAVGEQGQIVE